MESILNNIKSINSVNSENIVGNIQYIARCYLHPSQCQTYLLTLVFFSLRTTKHLVSRDAAGSKEQWTIPIMASAQQQSILRDYILFKTNNFFNSVSLSLFKYFIFFNHCPNPQASIPLQVQVKQVFKYSILMLKVPSERKLHFLILIESALLQLRDVSKGWKGLKLWYASKAHSFSRAKEF